MSPGVRVQSQITSTEPHVCNHVQTVHCRTKSASIPVKENYHKFTQTEFKKNLLPHVVLSVSHAVGKSTGDSINVPDTRGKRIDNVWLMRPMDGVEKYMSAAFQQAKI